MVGGSPAPVSGTAHRPTLTAAELAAALPQHRRAIYKFIRRRGFSAEDADDLTQETLTRAYLNLARFQGACMTSWLYRIAANVSIDHLRRQRLKTCTLEPHQALPSSSDDPLAPLELESRRSTMLELVRRLPECHQRVVRLRYFEERSIPEVAQRLNCSPIAAKLRVFRAVTALRKLCAGCVVPADLL